MALLAPFGPEAGRPLLAWPSLDHGLDLDPYVQLALERFGFDFPRGFEWPSPFGQEPIVGVEVRTEDLPLPESSTLLLVSWAPRASANLFHFAQYAMALFHALLTTVRPGTLEVFWRDAEQLAVAARSLHVPDTHTRTPERRRAQLGVRGL